MKQAFTNAFPSCTEANKCDCGTDPEAAVIVGRPELAFLTGVSNIIPYNILRVLSNVGRAGGSRLDLNRCWVSRVAVT